MKILVNVVDCLRIKIPVGVIYIVTLTVQGRRATSMIFKRVMRDSSVVFSGSLP